MRTSVKYMVIYRHKDKYSISEMCRFFKVSRSGYYGYVSEIIKSAEERATAENEAFNKTVNSIVDAGIRDRDEAYRYAIQMGMSEQKATEAANAAVTMANRKLTEQTFRFIINHGFDKTQAKEYALASGLDEQTAERLAAYAEEISSSPYLTSDYLDYLRQKEDQYK